MGVEEIETGEPKRAERKAKTKGILKNSGETKKSRKHHSNHGKHVEINLEQTERKHRSRKHRDENRDSGIYDTPKGSTVKWKEDLNAAYERSRQRSLERSVSAVNRTIVTDDDEAFYENLVFLETSRTSSVHVEQVYDVPRSNSEALYFNQNFEDDLQTYDTPKTGKSEILELDYFQSDYDVPKTRDHILPPIEEENPDYDTLRGISVGLGADQDNIYENQDYRQNETEPIYMNELSDDKSSGYRSSPSLHSDDTQPSSPSSGDMFGSVEDVCIKDTENMMNLRKIFSSKDKEFPERHDVAVDTSNTLERQYQEINRNKNRIKEKVKEKDRFKENVTEKVKESIKPLRTIEKQTNEHMHIEFEEFDPENSLTRNIISTEYKNGFKKEEIKNKKNERQQKGSSSLFNLRQTFSRSESDLLRPSVEPVRKRNPSVFNLNSPINSTLKKSTPTRTQTEEMDEDISPAPTQPNRRRKDTVDQIKLRFESIAAVKNFEVFESRKSMKKPEKMENQEPIPSIPSVPVQPVNTAAVSKDAKDRDRSVDVYHETIRQRTVKEKTQISADLFKYQSTKTTPVPTPNTISTKATPVPNPNPISSKHTPVPALNPVSNKPTPVPTPNHVSPDTDETGLPSVRKLLARFETGKPSSTPAPERTKTASRVSTEEKPSRIPPQLKNQQVRTETRKIAPTVGVDNLESPPLVYKTGKQDTNAHKDDSKWDPEVFVKSLYNLPALDEPHLSGDDGPVSLDSSQSCPSIEGYMEKLPAGRKRPTLWNSWKKHYFVARNGILHIYSNKAQTELLEKLELFGGQVDFMDSSMLGIEDRKGQYVVVRCASHIATQEWESALSFHTLENYAKTFISPHPIPRDIKTMSNIIVVDLGGASIRAGICGPTPYLPRLFFPSLMAVNPASSQEKYFGFDALKPEIRSKCNIYSPLLPSKNIDKYSVDLVALCGFLLKVFQDLRVDPKRSELQLSVPRNFNDKTKIAIASLLFDEFEVKSVNMGHQSVFTLHSYNTDTGIVVDIGERMEIVPIVSGYKVQSGLSRAATGGMEMCNHMTQALLGRNYSLTAHLDTYIVRQVVERLCYVSRSFETEMENFKGEEKSLNLSEGSRISSVTLGPERFQITEGIFKPEGWGLDQDGVHLLVKKAISECSVDVRKQVSQSIFLGGGLTLVPGFKHRLELELTKLLPVRPRVHASPYRYHAAFLGACAHATSKDYERTRITRAQWQARNVDVAKSWVL